MSTKRKQLDFKLRKLYWLIGRKSQLPLQNKLLVYTAILKPIWTYGVQLCGSGELKVGIYVKHNTIYCSCKLSTKP